MKDRRVEFHEGALADVQSAFDWYLKHSSIAAVEFVEELQRAADTICEAPTRWPLGEN